MLMINDLNFSFQFKNVFHFLNLTLEQPRHLLVGANGVGKTSLLAIVAGLYPHSSGTILWRGQPLTNNVRIAAMTSALVTLPDFITAKQVIELHQGQWQREVSRQPIDASNEFTGMELSHLVERLGFGPYLHTKVGHLSSGNLQKLRLILALGRPSQLLLLDEACSAMDIDSQAIFYQLISEYTGQVIAISHEAGGFSDDYVEVRLA